MNLRKEKKNLKILNAETNLPNDSKATYFLRNKKRVNLHRKGSQLTSKRSLPRENSRRATFRDAPFLQVNPPAEYKSREFYTICLEEQKMSCPGFYHIATIHLLPSFLPPFFFSLSSASFFFRSRSFLIVVSKLRRWSLVSGRNRPFYSTSIISPAPLYNGATTERRPPSALHPRAPTCAKSKLSSNWNFVAVR